MNAFSRKNSMHFSDNQELSRRENISPHNFRKECAILIKSMRKPLPCPKPTL
jgi:hypothetical protein